MFKRNVKRFGYLASGGLLGKGLVKKIVEKDGYTVSARSIIDEMGDKKITRAFIKRTPLSGTVKLLLDGFSLG